MSESNRVLNTFQQIRPLYQRSDVENTPEGITISVGAKLYIAYPTTIASPIYIVDTKNIIHSKKISLPLMEMDIKQLDKIFDLKDRDYITKRIGDDPRIKGWDDLGLYTFGTDYSFNDLTLGKWLDVSTGQVTEEWTKLLADIIEYNCVRDPALALSNKATLARGYVMRYQPHELQITPPNTGKSTFFELIGKNVDKATKNTLLGSVKWTDDKAAGLFADQYFALAIDQIESQTIENMAGFLLGHLESGKSRVAGGGGEMMVQGACPLVITANPLALSGSHTAIMRDILGFLCRNSYAMGRRFGIINYGGYAPLVDKGYDDVEHRRLVETYRALEERLTDTLQKFWLHPKIKAYCNQPIYDPSLYDKIEACDTVEVRSFFLAHYAHSYPHLRGGALNCALSDNLPKLAKIDVLMMDDLDKIVDDIIEKANEYAELLKVINVSSIEYTLS
jgi:hypothetical protein